VGSNWSIICRSFDLFYRNITLDVWTDFKLEIAPRQQKTKILHPQLLTHASHVGRRFGALGATRELGKGAY
jgi:hypothetical protein